jgi:carbamoyltransferase
MTAILGLNVHHADSSACLMLDGKLIGAVAEERLGDREKHTSKFPINAIRHLLAENNLRLRDISHIALARQPGANINAKLKYTVSNFFNGGFAAAREFLSRQKKTKSEIDLLNELLGEGSENTNLEVVFVEHHLAHIASSYYASNFESITAGFSYDASGDFCSAMMAKCEGQHIEVLQKALLPDSLGFFYTAMCQYIGFDQFGEEYKVMGLAPYGEDQFANEMDQLVSFDENNLFKLNKNYIQMHDGRGSSGQLDEQGKIILAKMYKPSVETLLGVKPRNRYETPISQIEMDIAKSTQRKFERVALQNIKKLQNIVPRTEQLVLAGGCALNGVTNAKIAEVTNFNKHYIQSAASDDGTAIGAAYWCLHNIIGSNERFPMEHAYWGPLHNEQAIKLVSNNSKYFVRKFSNESELINSCVENLIQGKVVGWYQGRSEWGPRALGNRSILANPQIKNMKDVINKKIKKRESFRPFAPSVLYEDANNYFDHVVESPFMQHVCKFKPEWAERLRAVSHIDSTGRLQTVKKENNRMYYNLIKEFSKKSGVSILLNTSFNENEPVVDTPDQAHACFERTDMDALYLGQYYFVKINDHR